MSFGFGFGFPKNYVAALFNTPASLFTTGVNGAWYDPSDFSTMFQDAAGTTPVTAVGQPVGLMLDKSKGLVLGSEKIVNGDGTSLTGWSNGNNWWVVSNGRFYHASSSTYNELSQTFTTTQGVKISFDYEVVSGVAEFFYVKNDNSVITNTLTGVKTFTAILPAGIKQVGFNRSSGSTAAFYIDNISVRELPGNHAFNPSGNSANFPVLSARYNLLTKTEDFSDAAWTKIGSATTPSANTINFPALNGTVAYPVTTLATVGTSATFSVELSGTGTVYIGCYRSGGSAYEEDSIKVLLTDTPTIYSVSHTIVNSGQTGFGGYISREADSTATTVTANKAQLRYTNDALNQPSYQRVNTSTDYDTAGFKPYLSFNGVNQWLQTNSIDFTYGDKMFVSSGVSKTGVNAAVLVELSASIDTNNGAIDVFAPGGGGDTYQWLFGSKGNASLSQAYVNDAQYKSPNTKTISGIGSISGSQSILRINGVQAAQSNTIQGTGNYGNYPLYIGARAGSSLWFNGRLYGLVVAGKAASASEIASTEAWLNQKTGAYEGTPGSLSLDLNFTDNTYYSRVI